ncbi:hypothetical protein HMN09_00241400 [Mycena chlorophos]|uniref:Protein kish n=1 Tax=Mycena chlorophos TaxID=658473 RepID=A0A8H6WIP6_MYCCL|nr:hypothetical protein HMN09_00241400 [Mycena chlorophos]
MQRRGHSASPVNWAHLDRRRQSLRPFHVTVTAFSTTPTMSALFNFQSLLLVILLLICTCTYVRAIFPSLIDRNKTGFLGLFFMSARIGERLSPYVALACIVMAVTKLVQ